MFRRGLLAGLMLVLAAMFTFVGCSDDANPINSNVGDPNSPTFQPMKAAIATAVDSTLGIALKFAYKPNRFPSEIEYEWPPLLGPNDSLLYNYVGDWHILYLGLTASVDYNFSYVDSARFWDGARAVQYFHPTKITAYDLIHHQNSSYKGTGDEYSDLQTYVDLNFRDANTESRYVYGTSRVLLDNYYVENNEQKNVSYDFDAAATDLTYSLNSDDLWNTSHVTGGELNMTVTVDDGMASSEWDVTVDFDENGLEQITATDGMKVYTYTQTPAYQ